MGISVTQLAIVLAIVIVLFGTKRLRTVGADLGGAIKGFRSALKEGEALENKEAVTLPSNISVEEGSVNKTHP
ncbi:Sec-independent protein translocase subunit TatA [Methylomarinum vadi]|uniref:Sec-independent protein translocase subunit TatA n=1 Tax=Methylomarinum vadi TaxID=438855 RepID=UPI0004DFC4DA|nr:Sec-independent protein translocase subunit TatA [Methylomarinum vadi]